MGRMRRFVSGASAFFVCLQINKMQAMEYKDYFIRVDAFPAADGRWVGTYSAQPVHPDRTASAIAGSTLDGYTLPARAVAAARDSCKRRLGLVICNKI